MRLPDGNARVTVSMEEKDNNFGRGFGAHISVSLACNQRAEDVATAADLATALASSFVQDAFEEANNAFDATADEGRIPDRKRR